MEFTICGARHPEATTPCRVALLENPEILSTHVRATASLNSEEGVGAVEAPRGTLMHHYRVNERGLITWANLVIATGLTFYDDDVVRFFSPHAEGKTAIFLVAVGHSAKR